jgi:hypothetical protein
VHWPRKKDTFLCCYALIQFMLSYFVSIYVIAAYLVLYLECSFDVSRDKITDIVKFTTVRYPTGRRSKKIINPVCHLQKQSVIHSQPYVNESFLLFFSFVNIYCIYSFIQAPCIHSTSLQPFIYLFFSSLVLFFSLIRSFSPL